MKAKLTKRKVEELQPRHDRYIVHDTELPGVQLRVEKSGRKTYLVYYRTKSRDERRLTLGPHGTLTSERARVMARNVLADVLAGNDPSKERERLRRSMTVEELCGLYISEHAANELKASTVRQYRWLIRKCITPNIGNRRITDVTRDDIEFLKHALQETPRNANQSISLLSTVFKRAAGLGQIPNGSNPCMAIRPFKTKRLDRFLSRREVERLSKTLEEFERGSLASPYAIAAIRLLLTTGCRKNEICQLLWNEVDFEKQEIRLGDSKTGAKRILLNSFSVAVLRKIPRTAHNEYVIAGSKPSAPLIGLQRIWERIRTAAGLDDVRLHDLRHTFASIAISDGVPLAVVGSLLGHATPQATSRYAHLADKPVRDASERVGRAVTVQ